MWLRKYIVYQRLILMSIAIHNKINQYQLTASQFSKSNAYKTALYNYYKLYTQLTKVPVYVRIYTVYYMAERFCYIRICIIDEIIIDSAAYYILVKTNSLVNVCNNESLRYHIW